MREFIVKGEYGIMPDQLIVRQMRALNEINVRKNFLKFIKREHGAYMVSFISSNIRIEEV